MKKLMTEKNDALNAKLGPLFGWLFPPTEPNPIGVNTLMMQLGMAPPVWRLPYTFREADERKKAVAMVNAIGIEHFCGNGVKALEDSDFLYTLSTTSSASRSSSTRTTTRTPRT